MCKGEVGPDEQHNNGTKATKSWARTGTAKKRYLANKRPEKCRVETKI